VVWRCGRAAGIGGVWDIDGRGSSWQMYLGAIKMPCEAQKGRRPCLVGRRDATSCTCFSGQHSWASTCDTDSGANGRLVHGSRTRRSRPDSGSPFFHVRSTGKTALAAPLACASKLALRSNKSDRRFRNLAGALCCSHASERVGPVLTARQCPPASAGIMGHGSVCPYG
jgi:hypothetical protein